MTFKVGDKVTCEAFGDGLVEHHDPESSYPLLVVFDSGEKDIFTLDGQNWNHGSAPHKNIKHKEAQGMNKSDLKTGMVVESENGWKAVVFSDAKIITDGVYWNSIDSSFVKVYSQPAVSIDYLNTSIESRTLIWQREEVKEMTVDAISKALGYPVKVVGGE